MPLENKTRTNLNKPLTPALSSNIRTRPAFAPRLAGVGPTSPITNPQRSLRQQTLSPERNDEGRTISLNSNITPRSGARASRVDTDSPSTPDTSARARVVAGSGQQDDRNDPNGIGITSPLPTPTHPRPKSSDQLSMLPTARRISGGSNASSAKEDSKFFRADDVRGNAAPGKINSSRPKSTLIASPRSPRVSPKKASAERPDRLDEKFFYANNISSQQSPRPRTLLATKFSASASAASSTRSLPTQKSTSSPSSARSPTQSTAAKPAQFSSIQQTRQRSSSNAPSTANLSERRRSSSLNIKPVLDATEKGHRKSLSTNSATLPPIKTEIRGEQDKAPKSAHVRSGSISHATAMVSPNSSSARSASLTSAHTTDTSLTSEVTKAEPPPPPRPPLRARHTRGSSESTHIQPVTQAQLEAAANARRERKVLDLEISNSSLLAINRTLEKELRKQNTELRRFRRLSRSGRLSLTPSHRIVSGASMSTLTTLDEDDQDSTLLTLSPSSSEEGSFDDEYPSNEDDNDSAFTQSSDVMRRRARDEKRLMQDLQRHQQILLDSQKLTQSIQRCLNSTDEMIKEGSKALAYQVEASDLQIGGRVLTHDDDEALSEVDFSEYTQSMSYPRQDLLSPIMPIGDADEDAMWARAIPNHDGDDGIYNSPQEARSVSPSHSLSPIILPER